MKKKNCLYSCHLYKKLLRRIAAGKVSRIRLTKKSWIRIRLTQPSWFRISTKLGSDPPHWMKLKSGSSWHAKGESGSASKTKLNTDPLHKTRLKSGSALHKSWIRILLTWPSHSRIASHKKLDSDPSPQQRAESGFASHNQAGILICLTQQSLIRIRFTQQSWIRIPQICQTRNNLIQVDETVQARAFSNGGYRE
jgi:hypothetical protein